VSKPALVIEYSYMIACSTALRNFQVSHEGSANNTAELRGVAG